MSDLANEGIDQHPESKVTLEPLRVSGLGEFAIDSQEQKVFVEIGFGWDPAFLGAGDNETRKKQFANVHYIGIDPDGHLVPLAKDAASRHRTEHMLSIGFNEGRITDLSIAEGTVDEVYIANVLAESHAVQSCNALSFATMNLEDALQAEVDPDKKKTILRQLYPRTDMKLSLPLSVMLSNLEVIKKLLKPDGKLTIVETNTPTNIEIVKLLHDDLGFDIDGIVTENDAQEWKQMEDRYHMQEGWIIDQAPYIITAHPRT